MGADQNDLLQLELLFSKLDISKTGQVNKDLAIKEICKLLSKYGKSNFIL